MVAIYIFCPFICETHEPSLSLFSYNRGNTYGVAKDVKMVHVMAENGRPRSRALRWIADQKNENPDTPMVLATNYYGPSSLLGTRAAVRAMRQVIDAGVVVVAGTPYEENGACGLGRLKVWKEDFPEIITAAYTDCNATNLEFNEAIGGDLSCVDILAPGVDISAPVGRADDAYSSGGGTSTGLVAALVAGAAALYLEKDPDLTSADVLAAMVADATDGVVKGLDEGAPNKFLYTGNL